MTTTETTELAATKERLRRTENACQLLGRTVTGLARTLEAAHIELVQGKPGNALEWILNATEYVHDGRADQWNGTETAQEWFDRTDERRVTA